MKRSLKEFIKKLLKSLGIGVTSYANLQKLRQNSSAASDILLLKSFDNNAAGRAIHLLESSKSQFRQDLFVLSELNFKNNGFFVEFGAANGVDISNTHLLEKEFNWSGILAEPARIWHKDLKANRIAKIEFDCVWKESGKLLDFTEVDIVDLSTISEFKSKDMHSESRKPGKSYSVNTISLLDLLERHDAPRRIDYLSIDTEGSEYEILRNFDFDSYRFSVITCEHNYTSDREKIYDLLISKGYQRKFEQLSKFDDWYVRQ